MAWFFLAASLYLNSSSENREIEKELLSKKEPEFQKYLENSQPALTAKREEREREREKLCFSDTGSLHHPSSISVVASSSEVS
jgi:hypothetical protein